VTDEGAVAGPRLPNAEWLLALAGEEYEPHRQAAEHVLQEVQARGPAADRPGLVGRCRRSR
jgi:hypothetical protein